MTRGIKRAPLVEVFTSIQGEGMHAGEPQHFLRLAGCPIRCHYCDTPAGLTVPDHYWLRLGEEEQGFENPVDVGRTLELIEACDRHAGSRRTLSVTGGEPLVHGAFLVELLGALKDMRRIHLETAGIHLEALRALRDLVDHVSMDWKLDSTMEMGSFGAVHAEFLACLAAARIESCVKIVLTPAVTLEELSGAFEVIRGTWPSICVILQPVTPDRNVTATVSRPFLARCLMLAERSGLNVRVLPQIHKLLGLP